jgi:hypothetical protein
MATLSRWTSISSVGNNKASHLWLLCTVFLEVENNALFSVRSFFVVPAGARCARRGRSE